VIVRAISIAVVLTSVGIALGSTAAYCQSLGELAERQKAQRKGGAKRVITDEDLAKRGGSAPANVSADSAAPTAEAAPSTSGTPKSEEDQRADRRKDWEQRLAAAEKAVEQATNEAADAQAAISNRRGGFALGEQSARAAERLKVAQEKLAAAQQRLEALDEERRREGF
jgi:exonuclease VII small subunit